jgi:hypothetical protein
MSLAISAQEDKPNAATDKREKNKSFLPRMLGMHTDNKK